MIVGGNHRRRARENQNNKNQQISTMSLYQTSQDPTPNPNIEISEHMMSINQRLNENIYPNRRYPQPDLSGFTSKINQYH